MEIAWYHGQTRVGGAPDEARYRVDNDAGLYRLVILGVTVTDAGDWRCLATNSYGQCISACTLQVVGTPASIPGRGLRSELSMGRVETWL